MSSVKKFLITVLNVGFDAVIRDSETGEVLFELNLPMRFEDRGDHYECTFCPGLTITPGLGRKWLVVDLRIDGVLWHSNEVECPVLFKKDDMVKINIRWTPNESQWQKLLEMAE